MSEELPPPHFLYYQPRTNNFPQSPASEDEPKKRRKKDPKAPKNPVSAYLFYVAEQRVKNTGKSDGKSFAEVAKDLGKQWKNLSFDEKQVC
jgi:hypothetical protein